MNEEGESRYSILFRVYQGGGLYSIPVQYVTRVEPIERQVTAIMRSPDHIVGVYPLRGKNICVVDLGCLLGLERTSDRVSLGRSLLVIESTGVGFLVEAVLGVEALYSRQSSGPLSKQLVQSVYSCDGRDELVFELNVPSLLSICR